MNPQRTVSNTFWAMVLVQTLGSVDIFTAGPRKMPAPRQYVAIATLWSILHMLAGSARYGRLAAHLSLLTLLTAMVLGPFGPQFLAFLNYVSAQFSLAPASPGGGASSSPSSVPSPGPSTTAGTPGGVAA